MVQFGHGVNEVFNILIYLDNFRARTWRTDSLTVGTHGSALLNIENLVLRARSEFNGFAGAGANHFGVLEFWSIGVLIKMKARI